jgi:hypothetical protein
MYSILDCESRIRPLWTKDSLWNPTLKVWSLKVWFFSNGQGLKPKTHFQYHRLRHLFYLAIIEKIYAFEKILASYLSCSPMRFFNIIEVIYDIYKSHFWPFLCPVYCFSLHRNGKLLDALIKNNLHHRSITDRHTPFLPKHLTVQHQLHRSPTLMHRNHCHGIGHLSLHLRWAVEFWRLHTPRRSSNRWHYYDEHWGRNLCWPPSCHIFHAA